MRSRTQNQNVLGINWLPEIADEPWVSEAGRLALKKYFADVVGAAHLDVIRDISRTGRLSCSFSTDDGVDVYFHSELEFAIEGRKEGDLCTRPIGINQLGRVRLLDLITHSLHEDVWRSMDGYENVLQRLEDELDKCLKAVREYVADLERPPE